MLSAQSGAVHDKQKEIAGTFIFPDQKLASFCGRQTGNGFQGPEHFLVFHLKMLPEEVLNLQSLHSSSSGTAGFAQASRISPAQGYSEYYSTFWNVFHLFPGKILLFLIFFQTLEKNCQLFL